MIVSHLNSKHIHNRHRDPTAVWLRVGPELPVIDLSANIDCNGKGQSSSKSTDAGSEEGVESAQ